MIAETLRKAAALMRERAEAATPGPWVQAQTLHAEPTIKRGHDAPPDHNRCGFGIVAVPSYGAVDYGLANAEHIAGMHPAVALAVADWLDMVAGNVVNYGPNAESPWVRPHVQMALAVARAYLGEVTP